MWDALGNNPLLFSYFFYYRLRYIYKISNDNLQVDFDEGTIPPAYQRQQSPATIFSHTLAQRPTYKYMYTHNIYTKNNRTHGARCRAASKRERENTSHKCSIFFLYCRELAFLFIDWQFQYFSPTSSHMPKTPFYFASLLWIQSLKCDSLLRWLLCVLNVYYFHSPPTVFIPRTLICVFFHIPLCIGITYLGMVRKAFKI